MNTIINNVSYSQINVNCYAFDLYTKSSKGLINMKLPNTSEPFLAYRSFHTPLNTIKRFSDVGYDTICVFPAHTLNSRGTPYSQYPPTWIWYDKIDFSPFDKMIEDISVAMPDAKILCMIDLNSPCWLEHMNAYSCADSFNNLGKAVHNPDWVQATENYLRQFVSYANHKYSDRISAYVLACGATDEWYDYSNGTDNAERTEAWRKWQTSHGRPDPIDIPPQSVRDGVSFDGFLRNPQKDKTAIEYWHFCNESIADMILRFASVTREIVKDNAQIGCFYGYILEKTDFTLVSCGHLSYEKVLDSDNIDFLISPGTYTDRHTGGGSGFLIPAGSAKVRNKKLLHECDQRTHTSNNFLTPDITLVSASAWKDEKATIAGIKREAALGMINRTHLWWFDMWGDFYQGEAVMNTLRRVREIWNINENNIGDDMSEIAMIVDPESTYLVDQNHERVPHMNRGTRNKLNRIGAPFDVYSFNDIPLINNFERYKFVIFTSLFCVDSRKEQILKDYVLKDNRHVLWMYAPAIYSGDTFDIGNCQKLTGIKYGSDGLNTVCYDNWTSWYIHEYSDLTVPMLKKIAKMSGACITTEREIPVYAGGGLLAVHSAEGGKTELCVDSEYTIAYEQFTQKSYEIKDGKFEYDFGEPDTALFEMKK